MSRAKLLLTSGVELRCTTWATYSLVGQAVILASHPLELLLSVYSMHSDCGLQLNPYPKKTVGLCYITHIKPLKPSSAFTGNRKHFDCILKPTHRDTN